MRCFFLDFTLKEEARTASGLRMMVKHGNRLASAGSKALNMPTSLIAR